MMEVVETPPDNWFTGNIKENADEAEAPEEDIHRTTMALLVCMILFDFAGIALLVCMILSGQ